MSGNAARRLQSLAGIEESYRMQTTESKWSEPHYLTCEKRWIYFALITVAGFWGAYTYLLRGNVFCNAQTGNVVLMGLALGAGKWKETLYYVIPISAYLMGAFLSELVPNPVKHRLAIRWDTLLILVEMLAVLFLGFLPDSAPVQITQVVINFVVSMQYNTFRQAEGIPGATTFATNHIRQIGIGLAREVKHRHADDHSHREKLFVHLRMLIFFFAGASAGSLFAHLLGGRSIWLTLIPLAVVFAALLKADLGEEKDRMEQKPSGH